MAGSISVYISRQRNPKLFRWCDLAIIEGYQKWQLSAYFRNRMEDILDASMKSEKIKSIDMGTVCVGEREGGVTKGPGILLYLISEDGESYPCIRAYIDYMRSMDRPVSREMCNMIEGDIQPCRDNSQEYIVGYEDLESQRKESFSEWVAREERQTLTQPSYSDTIKSVKKNEVPTVPKVAVAKENSESMTELKEEDLFGFF